MSNDKEYTALADGMPIDGVHLIKSSVAERKQTALLKAIALHNQLEGLHGAPFPHRLKNVMNRLNAYREVSATFRDAIITHQELRDMAMRERAQIAGKGTPRSGKKWTDDEDSILIDRAVTGDDVQAIALTLGRTPTAVSGRISHLVGVKRISEAFAGTIRGQLNGEEVEGVFVGNVSRK